MAEPVASVFPGALDGNTQLGADQINIKSFTLGSNVNNSQTTIPASAVISGITAPFYLLADSELIYVESISGSDFNVVVRGAGGTAAASHTSGITLFVVYAAGLFNQLKRAIVAIETELGIAPSGSLADVVTRLNVSANSDGTLKNTAQRIVQVVHTQTGSVATGTTILPLDDTIPQNIEGDQYMSLAITPTSTTNKLLIEVTIFAAHSAANSWIVLALFQDSVANALAVGAQFVETASGGLPLSFKHEMTSGTISPITFKVRIGGNQAGTLTFNGAAGARWFGGVMASSIRITEVKV